MRNLMIWLCLFFTFHLNAQLDWQQKVDYSIEVDMDVKKGQYDGKMNVEYFNNSQDELSKIYFHLYYNAFQPGSLMDIRLKHIKDPDKRMVHTKGTKEKPIFESKIASFDDTQIGFHKIKSIKQNGKTLNYKVMGTIMEVVLDKAVSPNSSVKLNLEWKAQVPDIVRRGGKHSAEGIEFSMTQWYPKIAAYDNEGWHLDEYIAREFYAPFGDFDVKITLPSNYIIGSSGKLQNEDKMPGYSNHSIKNKKNTWHFIAENIHDFAWSADTKFRVDKEIIKNGPTIYYLYDQNLDKEYLKNWTEVQPLVSQFFTFMSDTFGKYPWETYTIVQGGDGGMEYGTSTLVTGRRSFDSLLGVIYHEVAHSWFQHMFAINETKEEWMDEGFTSYAEARGRNEIMNKNKNILNPYQKAYDGYYYLADSNVEEPLSLLSDYYNQNFSYSLAAYYKGQVYVSQLAYIIGQDNLDKTFQAFHDTWRFKHPKSFDFQKIAQKISGINIKWYQNMWINTIRTIDYGIEKVENNKVTLKNYSDFPMPLDVLVEFKDGTKKLYYIPLHAMRGEKPKEEQFYKNIEQEVLPAWGWTYPTYEFEVDKEIERIEIDYTFRLADVNRYNNIYPKEKK